MKSKTIEKTVVKIVSLLLHFLGNTGEGGGGGGRGEGGGREGLQPGFWARC